MYWRIIKIVIMDYHHDNIRTDLRLHLGICDMEGKATADPLPGPSASSLSLHQSSVHSVAPYTGAMTELGFVPEPCTDTPAPPPPALVDGMGDLLLRMDVGAPASDGESKFLDSFLDTLATFDG